MKAYDNIFVFSLLFMFVVEGALVKRPSPPPAPKLAPINIPVAELNKEVEELRLDLAYINGNSHIPEPLVVGYKNISDKNGKFFRLTNPEDTECKAVWSMRGNTIKKSQGLRPSVLMTTALQLLRQSNTSNDE